MKAEIKEKIEAEIQDWQYMKDLPPTWFGFVFTLEMKVYGDVYDLYSYENAAIHRKITVYYHEETKEYKVRVLIGLTEFCNIEYISPTRASLEKILLERFETTLQTLAQFNVATISCIVLEKKILEWDYGSKLPEIIEGFKLFIRPDRPVKTINGSYIIFDYSDFSTDSNFIIYYNVFRDEFFGEAKIRKIPEMNYDFDSHELIELEEKLDEHLLARLKDVRSRIDQ